MAWAHIRTERRGERSGSDPAGGAPTVDGEKEQKAGAPTHTVECVIWSITNGTVMVCIQLPLLLISAALQKREKSRERKADQAPAGAGMPSGARSDSSTAGRTYRRSIRANRADTDERA